MRPMLTLRHYTEAPLAHSHDHAQLVFGLSGHLDMQVDGRGSRVQHSSVMVLPVSTHHACDSRDGSHCLVLDVPPEQWLIQSLGEHADASRRLLDQPAHLTLDARQSQLVQWLASGPVDDPLIVQQGAVLLLASLNPALAPTVPGRRLPYAAFNAYIERHAAHPLQVADLARIADLSVARLHARFIAECAQTPMDYLRSRRLHTAVKLLKETPLPIGEIAARVGYSSQSAFAAAMLREFGASPGALRRCSQASLAKIVSR
ncbi:helix-turn-helix transcriptional regulator [Pseudomonas sp. MAFF 730085]|uniref:Helix-turn-helix transcriptional regulator n=1 Tax=Pseudomonas kitaguniensis TaxID=2607908 RepID=A0A5N7JTC1_9PSED|nr:AraC family transcriptional regulator [Pseudomonas kitaguniensis]MPQ84648.1 helix-turn-helix transcriptional regulator [Pseudomonas kitaguniensis]MPR03426.1 helix-turn-helix transcriptional regulator [Pseudomonas kitaguniensis]